MLSMVRFPCTTWIGLLILPCRFYYFSVASCQGGVWTIVLRDGVLAFRVSNLFKIEMLVVRACNEDLRCHLTFSLMIPNKVQQSN